MDFKQIQLAVKQLALEKSLPEEIIMDALNTALAAAYRKDFGNKNQNIIFKLDPKTGEMEVYDTKVVVDFPEEILAEIRENGLDKKYVHGKTLEEVEVKMSGVERQKSEEELEREMAALEETFKYNPKNEILLEEAKKIAKKHKLGDTIITKLEIPSDFGRMAAQTAKQVIIQKIREAERGIVFEEYKSRIGELLNATVQRREGRNVLIDLGKNTTAIMLPEHQVATERFNPGDRIKVYLVSVEQSVRGPQIVVSRTHPKLIARLFESEIPEIASGLITIMGVAREAGFRSKVSVKSNEEGIDPIGSCVGQRGVRIQTIIAELGGEKIDIIEYKEAPDKYIAAALSPAKVVAVNIIEGDKENPGLASVVVPADQLSLAIGREGQNVRLAAKLTGWKVNIVKEGESAPVFSAVEVKSAEEGGATTAEEVVEVAEKAQLTDEVGAIEENLKKEGAETPEKAEKE